MRCPKCHYLSFDPEPRCRNCGYSLSLDDPDLLLRETAETSSALTDLSLREPVENRVDAAGARIAPAIAANLPVEPSVSPVLNKTMPSSEQVSVAARRPRHAPAAVRSHVAPTTELPLFVKGFPVHETEEVAEARLDLANDQPMVRVPAEPRPPLSVRRKAVDDSVPRSRPAPPNPTRPGPLDRDLLHDLQPVDAPERKNNTAERRAATREVAESSGAGALKRLLAAVLDLGLMTGLAAGIFWLTLRWCDLPLSQAATLWLLLPTSTFIMLVVVGYLLLFTAAGGQTLGKMALGIRVVGDGGPSESHVLTMKQALYRSVLTLPSVLVLGAGFAPALVGDERGLHDRLAHTRVVRA